MTDMPYVLTTADRVEIHELPGRYGDSIDDRNWPGLDTVLRRTRCSTCQGLARVFVMDSMTSSRSWNQRRPTHARI